MSFPTVDEIIKGQGPIMRRLKEIVERVRQRVSAIRAGGILRR